MKQFLLKSLLLLSIVFVSCGDDDSVPLGEYENGVFVVNEGNFLEGDGSITYYGRTTGTIDQTIFSGVNDASLGDVVQSMYVNDGLTYLVVNNSNKVEVVNSYTFESELTISDVLLPRYMTVSGDKGYLTEWVSFSDVGRVSVVNLTTGDIESQISVGSGAEDVEVVGNKIYVTNNFEGTMSIVDMANDNSATKLTLTSGPGEMVVDKNGDIWVTCRGGFNADFSPANNGALYKINTQTDEIESTFSFDVNYTAKIAIDPTLDKVYYFIGKSVYAHDVDNTSLSTEPLFEVSDATSVYGIGVDPETGVIYVGDSKSFLEDGEVFRYDANGTFLDSFQVGRGPNGFGFN